MKSGKEQIWRQYKRATRLQYICTLLTLHSAFGFGQKRLAEFEDAFSEVVSKVTEYAHDDVISEKLAGEMKEIGYDLCDLLKDGDGLTFSEMKHRDKLKEKKTLAEYAEVTKKLRAAGFYGKSDG